MPLIHSSQDYLPYIDGSISQKSLTSAQDLINAELRPSAALHPSLPPLREPTFSNPVSSALTHLSALSDPTSHKSTAIDLARYNPSTADESGSLSRQLRQAYVNASHLSIRATNLALLETYGRNAWLVSNSTLEDTLRSLEGEVDAAKRELEVIHHERRERQELMMGEMQGLEDKWKETLGRSSEVQVALVKLKNERRELGL